jgi:hypothetical protein
MSTHLGLWRYAVLHHTDAEGEPHYDFLFETSDTSSLVTFRLPEWPLTGPTHPATNLRDHRRIYLTFEGDIGGGRGHVARVGEGTVAVVQQDAAWILNHPDGRDFLRFEPLDPSAGQNDAWQVTTPTGGSSEG